MTRGNLLQGLPAPVTGERFETLLAHRQLRIERIVSSRQPESIDYCQPQDEWVLLVSGRAQLRVAEQTVELQSGDYLFLPAGTPHRVESTTQGALWLAIHLDPDSPAPMPPTSLTDEAYP